MDLNMKCLKLKYFNYQNTIDLEFFIKNYKYN